MQLLDLEPSGERKCKDGILADWMEYTKDTESPADFHLWSILTAISSALGRGCYKDRGIYTLYPNLFAVLVGESAIVHKSTAIGMAVKAYRTAHPKASIFSQKITTESFIHFLKGVCEETGVASGLVATSEFSVFFGKSVADPTLLQTLTDMFDCPDYWSYSTITRGVETCNNIFLTMLGGTTVEWLKGCMPEEAIGGGFFSRLILVHRQTLEDSRKIANPEDSMNAYKLQCRDNVINDLQVIMTMKGCYDWTPQAKKAFTEWYMVINNPAQEIPQLRGYYGRKADHLLKLSMVLAASRHNKLMIEEDDILSALALLNENEPYLRQVLTVMGSTEQGKNADRVIAFIRRKGKVGHSELMQNFSHALDKDGLRKVLETLAECGMIVAKREGRGVVYNYTNQERKD